MKKLSVTLTCAICGNGFHPEYGRERTSKYCSKACYRKGRWGDTPANNCRACGKDISGVGRRKRRFCSVACRAVWQSAEVRGEQHPTYKGLIRYGRNGAYRARRRAEHPHADSKGYVMEHRLVVESEIGRFLDPAEIVHHIDGDSTNNAIENLRVMTKAEHDALHSAERLGKPRPGSRRALQV